MVRRNESNKTSLKKYALRTIVRDLVLNTRNLGALRWYASYKIDKNEKLFLKAAYGAKLFLNYGRFLRDLGGARIIVLRSLSLNEPTA